MTPKEYAELVATIVETLDTHVSISIEKHVNGKIRELDAKITPVVDAFNTWSGWRRGMAAIFMPLSAAVGIGAGLTLILNYLNTRH